MNVPEIMQKMAAKYSDYEVNTIDGVKIDFPDGWVHLRPSNTEPIIRIYAEAQSEEHAASLANQIITDIKAIIG